MCGIVGYSGQREAQSILFNGLARLEYRGYDSCGIALASPSLVIFKDALRVAALKDKSEKIPGSTGIGHTRWATHGVPSRTNAHPHTDCSGKIAVVHNGIINNYLDLKNYLIKEGHNFVSETDTEVIPHLIEKYYQGSLDQAVEAALKEIQGSYAIIVMREGDPGLVFARKDSPLILGIGDNEYFLASDVVAFLEYTDRVIYLEDGDRGSIDHQGLKMHSFNKVVKRDSRKILWTSQQAQRGGYEHFMLKEIHEQPRIIRESIMETLASDGFQDLSLTEKNMDSLLVMASGTSYHAALLSKYVAGHLNLVSPSIEMSSEFNSYTNRRPFSTAVCLTQSGETADTLNAMRRLKQNGSSVVAVTNVLGSTAANLAEYTIFTRAGPEISVAATKSFTAQLITIYLLFLKLAQLSPNIRKELINELRQVPDKMQQVLDIGDLVAVQAENLASYQHIYYIGRGINYPIAMEGALKMKEVSYIHAEACAAGELKHGPFALLCKDTPVVAVVARDHNYEAMLTAIKEIKARSAPVYVITQEGDEVVQNLADQVIQVPVSHYLFSPMINTVAVQLLAYFAARKLGRSIDFPRNLAKSVTVE
jgi:glutamine---fructose-6-phosphate transaminase (isomerizing)